MKRIRFVLPKQSPTDREREEVVEYADNTTNTEIDNDFVTWVMENTNAYFEEIE